MKTLVSIFWFFFAAVNCHALGEHGKTKQKIVILAFTHSSFASCNKMPLTRLLSLSGDRSIVSVLKQQQFECPQGILDQEMVEDRLKLFLQNSDINYSVKLRWKGAHKVVFKNSESSSIEDELLAWGLEFLDQNLSLFTAKQVVITMQTAKENPVAGSGIKLLQVEFKAGCRLAHKTCLHFYFIDSAGNHYQRKRWFEVNALLPVAVAAHRLPNQAQLGVQSCVIKYVSLASLPEKPVFDCKLIEKMATHNRYLSGQAFDLSRLGDIPVVEKGDSVEINIFKGVVSIQAEGIAWASAQLGDLVLVSLKQSNLAFLARVEGKGRVVVDGS